MRRAKNASTAGQARGQIIDAISIRERPAEIEDGAIPGHWEGDLITGSNNTHIATSVERHSRFTMLVKVNGKDTASVVTALTKQVRKLPAELRRSLTWDRGMGNSPSTNDSPWPPMSKSISVTHKARGSEELTKTPMDCYVNTSPRALTCRNTLRWT